MKSKACQLGLLLSVMTVLALPASAGNEIVKCVDHAGHVTLTDQPCDDSSATVRLERTDRHAPMIERYPAPRALPGSGAWKKPEQKRMKMGRDVATLKAARAQWLLMDAAGKPQGRQALAIN
jgi:hypothetical protein